MGQCLECFGPREEARDPILDAQARARAAEAAQARHAAHAKSPGGKADAKARARDQAAAQSLSSNAHAQRINDIIN